MTADAHLTDRHLPVRSPAGVRSALVGDDRSVFEDDYRAALARASEDFDLTPIHEVVERWWRVAALSADPAANKRMLNAVADLRAGRPVPSSPWRRPADRRDA